ERTPDKGEVDSSSLSRPTIDLGAVAQLGEHLLCKQGVTGSIPVSSTKTAAVSDKQLAISFRPVWLNAECCCPMLGVRLATVFIVLNGSYVEAFWRRTSDRRSRAKQIQSRCDIALQGKVHMHRLLQ